MKDGETHVGTSVDQKSGIPNHSLRQTLETLIQFQIEREESQSE